MIYVNKMDIMGADFFHVLDMVRTRLKANAVAVQLPIGVESTFCGIIDLIKMKAEIYEDDLGTVIEEQDIPDKIKNRTLVLPGKVAVLKGELQEKLPDWNVMVGTNEAVEIIRFLKDTVNK